jgi:hypothetical protein
MELMNVDKASTFESKEACRQWIADRVIRFKLAVGDVIMPNGVIGFSQRKTDGRIVDTKEPGYKPDALDEPLKKYAKAVRQDKKWMAAMLYQK